MTLDYSSGINHHPSQIGIWIKYNGIRFSDVYNLKLHDGTVLKKMYPHGYSWIKEPNSDVMREDEVMDTEVSEIMLVPDEELWSPRPKGELRLQRNLSHIPEANQAHYNQPNQEK